MKKILVILSAIFLAGCMQPQKESRVPARQYPAPTPVYTPTPAPTPKPVFMPEAMKKYVKPTPTPKPKKTPAPTPVAESITIYTATWCNPCQILKKKLTARGIKYKEVDVDTAILHPDTKAFIGQHGIPTVRKADGTLVPGADI